MTLLDQVKMFFPTFSHFRDYNEKIKCHLGIIGKTKFLILESEIDGETEIKIELKNRLDKWSRAPITLKGAPLSKRKFNRLSQAVVCLYSCATYKDGEEWYNKIFDEFSS